MSLTIHLLGRPRIESSSGDVYQFRSRKSWALLTFLILSERPPSRRQLASLLFSEADDPLRALRWNLSEIRRSLGDGCALEGDPVVLRLPADSVVDVALVSKGAWYAAVDLPGLGSDLLDGIVLQGAPAFESWLLSEQRRLAAASEAILHEAALGSMSRGDKNAALAFAVGAAMMSPLDENHQALVIRLYRLTGDDAAAEQQFNACTDLFDRELGVTAGPAVQAAMHETRYDEETDTDPASVAAIVEAGSAAVAAGAVEAGVQSLRAAVRLADGTSATDLRVSSRLVLAEALVHSLRGFDEEGLAALYEADEIALANGDRVSVAHARAEVGYVDFLRARYDRAEVWLTDSLEFADGSPSMIAKATIYLGSVESDRANYVKAIRLLEQAIDLSRVVGEPRRVSYGLSMLGRISLLRNELDAAAEYLDASIEFAQREHWLAFLPYPRRCAVRCNWPVKTPKALKGIYARPLPGPASSRIPAGKECPRVVWQSSPQRGGRLHARSRCLPTPEPDPTDSPTHMSGSTATSSTPSATSACVMVIPRPNDGSTPCDTSCREPE